MDRHFTATTYLIDKINKRTLLHFHAKLQTYLPPGGHIEKNETPDEAALREITEETGLTQVEFIEFSPLQPGNMDHRSEILPMPYILLKEEIEDLHFHLDWIFYAYIDPSHREFDSGFRWFTMDDLDKEQDIFVNVKRLAKHGLEKFT